MRASIKTYQDVAARCSEYLPIRKDSMMNRSGEETISCMTCRHFEQEKNFCKIDRYDRIVRNHHIVEE
ncbi:hypothetical protein [Anaerosporobacter faecicola]|uniref:hypothetical protein n=1 Tax=Anaerosporobacter faecicola TaxID=2718714 RepID=UPI00143B5C28|nr:hypothetical protein [Anaerosporobacter faecicola]